MGTLQYYIRHGTEGEQEKARLEWVNRWGNPYPRTINAAGEIINYEEDEK